MCYTNESVRQAVGLIDPLIDSGITDIQKLPAHFKVSANAISIRLGIPYEAISV